MSVNKVNQDGSLTRIAGIMPVDQTYNPLSERPQSGVAVAAAVAGSGGGGLLPHLIIISEDGESEVKAVKGSTEIIATRTSAGHYECDVPEFGTWTIHAVLNGDDAQVNLVVDTVKVYTVDDSHFHADITVTYPSGGTCSCSKSGETTLYATGSPYTFTVHSAGAWTITATAYEKTFTKVVNVSSTGQTVYISVPDGATVTPTDDVQTLLACVGIGDSEITTLAELFADTTTLSAVINSANAVDYMVRSTTWVASSALVPTMTSDTTPSGECFCTSVNPSYRPFQAFDGDDTTRANMGSGDFSSSTPSWIGYKFDRSVTLSRAYVYQTSYTYNGCYIQSSSDGVTYTNISEPFTLGKNGQEIVFPSTTDTYFRLYVGSVQEGAATGRPIYTIQFYSETGMTENQDAMTYIGLNNYCANTLLADATWCNAICNSTYFESVLNAKVPTMTSNTTPEGQVIAESEFGNHYYDAWKAFDKGTASAYSWWIADQGHKNSWIGYTFPTEVTLCIAELVSNSGDNYFSTSGTIHIQNGSGIDLATDTYSGAAYTKKMIIPPSNNNKDYTFKVQFTDENGQYSHIQEIQFYGRKDV